MQSVEFIEAAYQTLIEFDLRRSFYNAGQRFEIHTYAGKQENALGYDLEALALVPLFLQLKVADLYPTFSKSPLQAARRKLRIADAPGCYAFPLHPDKKSARYKQHNLLAALHSNGNYSRYVAPLFHTKSDLERYKYSFREPFWGPSAAGLWDAGWYYWRDYLSFDHSISIVPHRQVADPTTVSHHYTYSLKKHVCFHSEPERAEDGKSFVESVYEELTRAQSAEPISLAAINTKIIAALEQIEEDGDLAERFHEGQSPRRQYFILANRLKRTFNIDCVLVSARG
ncbi:hypothetical protein [Dyella sp.]|uniref:hypothetical protein n=1 Tax=Dyella sp. TaxID=1869338 RepID=UPI002ED1D75A